MSTDMIVVPTTTVTPAARPLILFVDLAERAIGVTADPVIQDRGRTRFMVLPTTHGRPTKEAATALATELAPIAARMADDWTLDPTIEAVEVLPEGRLQEDPDQVRLGERAAQAWEEIGQKVSDRRWTKAEMVYTLELGTRRLQSILTQGEYRDMNPDTRLSHLLDRAEVENPGWGVYYAPAELLDYIRALQQARQTAYQERISAAKSQGLRLEREQARRLGALLTRYTATTGVSAAAHQRHLEEIGELSSTITTRHRRDRDRDRTFTLEVKVEDGFRGITAELHKRPTGRWHLESGTLLQALAQITGQDQTA